MKAAALCAGYGGLELGLQLAGWDIELSWFSEIDRHASTVLSAHHPNVPNLGDLTQISDPPAVDVVAAGFPCQPVSTAGKRKGVDDERWLIDDVCRIACDAGARWLVLENVPGIFTASRGHAFYQVLRALAEIGFSAEWVCVRASDVGAPHQRLRWFCVAYAEGAERGGSEYELLGASVGSAAEHRERDSETTADPDGDGHGQGQDARRVGRMDRQDAEGSRERERSRTQPGDRGDAATADADSQGPQGRPAVRQRGNQRPARSDSLVNWGPYEHAIRRWEHLSGRRAPAPTDDKRRLNPRFVEWMMGLDDGWVCDHVDGRSHQLRILGNGVVPQQAAWAIHQLTARTPPVDTEVTPTLQSGKPPIGGTTTYGGTP